MCSSLRLLKSDPPRMTDAGYPQYVRRSPGTNGQVDPYQAFSEIFGSEPPPGRIPPRQRSPWRSSSIGQQSTYTPSSSTLPATISTPPLGQNSPHLRSSVEAFDDRESLVGHQRLVRRSSSQVFSSTTHAPLSSNASYTTLNVLAKKTATTLGGRAIPTRSKMFGFRTVSGKERKEQPVRDSSTSMSRKPSSSTIASDSTIIGSSLASIPPREICVNPVMLSQVADKFKERIPIGDRVKNELTYKNAFTGQEAVDVLAYIIGTPDRNLALLMGRSLDAQKFFHDVTYDSRLRDSPSEVYQFAMGVTGDSDQAMVNGTAEKVNGFFSLVAECYSPTCTRKKLCYSISCPRRLEQQAHLTKNEQAMVRSLGSGITGVEEDEQKLWIHTVPPEIAETISKQEQKRQEVICEFIYTERDFVKDLEYVRDYWIHPLRRSKLIPEPRKEKFIRTVFLNIVEVHDTNIKFAEALTKRQQSGPVVEEIGDIVYEFCQRFEPFVNYGTSQVFAKFEFEKERNSNPLLAKFVDETERLPESRKLELNGYLSKPTTRLARYPLLLEAILKHTSESNPDYKLIPKAVAHIREFLIKVNEESGRSENRFALLRLKQSLQFRPGEFLDLKLGDPKRHLIYDGTLYRRAGESELHVYLFDNALVKAKHKVINKREILRVTGRPIPLELLKITEGEEGLSAGFRMGTSMIRSTSRSAEFFPISLEHLGKRGYETTLFAPSFQARKAWFEQIRRQQELLRSNADIFTEYNILTGFFNSSNRVTCANPFDGGRKLLIGTAQGIYSSDIVFEEGDNSKPSCTPPTLAVAMPNITQINVLDKYRSVLFLSDKIIYCLSLEALQEINDPQMTGKRAKQVASPATFYSVEECMGITLLSVVKSHSLNATIRVMEPGLEMVPQATSKRPPFRRFMTNTTQTEVFKPFHAKSNPRGPSSVDVPSATLSLSYLRSHLCLGCAKGFELLDLQTMKIESLLDPADTSLDFATKRDSLRPISIYRIGKEFLLNYSDFSFFINRSGWRSQPDWIIYWECDPQHIVLSYPYLIAYEQSFIEIRNMETELVRAVSGVNIRFLHESTHEFLFVHEDEYGYDKVVSMNFWEKQKQKTQAQAVASGNIVDTSSNPKKV